MKSAVLKGIKSIQVEEKEDLISKNDEVLIAVKRAGICGSDIHSWDTGEPNGLVMGHEYSGVVYDAGGREDLKIGDRVTALPLSPCGKCEACLSGNIQYCTNTWTHATGLSLDYPGAFAPTMAIHKEMVVKIPDNVSDEEAAMVEPSAVGYHAVRLANLKPESKVLVIGSGIIGLVSMMFAKLEGATYVAVSEVNPERGNKAVALGDADEYFDARDEKLLEKLYAKTEGKGFDCVIDCSGNSAAISTAVMAVKPGGTVVLVGISTSPVTVPMMVAVMKEVTLQGAIAYTKEEFETCLTLMSEKKIDVLKFLSDVVSLEEVQESFELLTSPTGDAIKILVDPNK